MDKEAFYRFRLAQEINDGWIVVSEGPSGAQLKKPKEMRSADQIMMIIGFVGLFLYGLGTILIIAALLDYLFFTDEETKFLAR